MCIKGSHANLLSRLPQEHQANAFEECWRKDWQAKEPHLLPAKHLAAWIQTNLYLSLADAPFDKEDTTLNPPAGACVTCPRRSGFNTSLFADVQGDQCLDAPCFHTKINAHIDREVAAHPELIQIENGYRNPKEQRPGAVRSGTYREVELTQINPDAEPVPPCEATKPALIVSGKRVGTIVTVCMDDHCPVHDPRAAARAAEHPAPSWHPKPKQKNRPRNAASSARPNRSPRRGGRAQGRRTQTAIRREQKQMEAEAAKHDKLRKKREATFERIVQEALRVFTAQQLRVILRALVNLDPYTFADDLAADISKDPDNDQRSVEEVLLAAIEGTADDKLTSFAVRLALAGHRGIPRENEFDFLAEAEIAFLTPKHKKSLTGRKKEPAAVKEAKAVTKKAKAKPTNQPIAA